MAKRGRKPGPFKHGTTTGYSRHYREGTPPCDPCKAANREYLQARALKIANGEHTPGRYAPVEHGTPSGYVKHSRAGTAPCTPCREAWAKRQDGYRKANPEVVAKEREADREYRKRPEVRAAIYARHALEETDPESPRYKRMKARKRRLSSAERSQVDVGVNVTRHQLQDRLAYYGGACWMCGADTSQVGLHWDHVKPLSRGGVDLASNLRPSCPPCNMSKGANWPFTPATLQEVQAHV